jgi:hypothetical protein
MPDTQQSEMRVVRVWFGSHVISSLKAEPALAKRHQDAMQRRFMSCRVTNDPAK